MLYKRILFISLLIFTVLCVTVFADSNHYCQFISQPLSQTVKDGHAVSFSVNASLQNGAHTPSYVWHYALPSAPNTWIAVPGESTYSFIASPEYNGAIFYCSVGYYDSQGHAGFANSNRALLAVVGDDAQVTDPLFSSLWYSILGLNDFSYMSTLASGGVYNAYSAYGGYNEISENGFTVYNNYVTSATWLKSSSGKCSMLLTIPFNLGVIPVDETIHLQFAFNSSGLSDTYQRQVSVSAGTSFNTSTFVTNDPCTVSFTAVDGYIEVGNYSSDGTPMRWYLIDIDVSRNLTTGANNNYGDFKYLFVRINFRYDRSSGKYFRFGFTDNNSFGNPGIENIYNSIVNVSSELQGVVNALEDLHFTVSSIDNNVLAIYDLLRNSGTQAIVQNITSQLNQMITPSSAWVDIVEEIHDKFDEQETQLSDLGDVLESLDKPEISSVVPDRTTVLNNQYVDFSLVGNTFSDVFEIPIVAWLLVAVLGIATISFILFGKKK